MEPPAGTVALLFTDIEGSTALAAALGEEWPASLAVHHEVVGGAILAHGGYVDRTEGDAFFAVFADPSAAVAAAVDAQRGLAARDRRLRVRMGLHAGHVERRATGYVGLEIHRAARVAAAAHGGQILLTDVIVTLARGAVETEDLGEHRLKDFPLPERLHCAVVDGVGASAFPPPRTLAIRPTNLPADDRLLLGREAELDAIVASFAAGDRLVTLTGMGGTGKTRLALAAGGTLLDAHPGGVWWVPLAGASGDDAVLSAVAAAVRVHDDGSRPVREAIAARIGSRPTLAVVDNLEHLPVAGPELAGLLALAPGLRVLATSQLPLRVGAEHVLALEPLRATAAIELLRRLGERARPGLQLDDELAGELCERLGHLPLAVELAAARLAVLTPSQLLQRLASPLALLKGGGHDTPARQRSLRATIEWTLGLLDDDPRELFRRLGVFAGAVELEDVEAVCGDGGFDVVDGVSALLDAGLLRRIEDGSGVIRFRLPEPLRQVAEERLDATPDGTALRGSHAAHVARAAWPGSRAFVSTMAEFARTSALQRDVLAALAWSRVHDRALVPLLAACRASWLWDAGPLAEPLALATEVLAVPEAEPDAAAHALLVLASIRGRLGARDEQIALTRRAADVPEASIEAHVQALGDLALAQAHESPGDARASDAAAWEAAQRSGSAHVLAGAAYGRAQLHVALEEPEAAATALDLAAELAAAADLTGAGWIDTVRADVHLQLAEYEDAGRLYVRSMETAWAAGEVGQLYNDLHTTARALAGAGRAEDALEVHGMAVAQGEEMGIGVGELHQFDDEQPIAAAHAALPRDVAEAAIARGRAVPLERRIDRARELAGSPARQP